VRCDFNGSVLVEDGGFVSRQLKALLGEENENRNIGEQS
jgi:hypothetical protein